MRVRFYQRLSCSLVEKKQGGVMDSSHSADPIEIKLVLLYSPFHEDYKSNFDWSEFFSAILKLILTTCYQYRHANCCLILPDSCVKQAWTIQIDIRIYEICNENLT